MFRRQSKAEPTATPPPVTVVKESGKGRPTPKRREAQRRRQPLGAPPKDRRAAIRRQREISREQRAKVRAAMETGDERHLPPRDRGPVRRFARDFIDSRRSAAEYFLVGAIVILMLGFIPNATVAFIVGFAWVGMVIVIVLDSALIARKLKREIRTRFPNENSRGVVGYTLLRSMQFRRLRMPKPQVRPGTKI